MRPGIASVADTHLVMRWNYVRRKLAGQRESGLARQELLRPAAAWIAATQIKAEKGWITILRPCCSPMRTGTTCRSGDWR
jgi:hypothetical protein